MESIRAITFDLSDLDSSVSRSPIFQSLISYKEAELGHMLLLNINRKECMESPLVQLHLTFLDLKHRSQGYSDFEGLYLVKERSKAMFY